MDLKIRNDSLNCLSAEIKFSPVDSNRDSNKKIFHLNVLIFYPLKTKFAPGEMHMWKWWSRAIIIFTRWDNTLSFIKTQKLLLFIVFYSCCKFCLWYRRRNKDNHMSQKVYICSPLNLFAVLEMEIKIEINRRSWTKCSPSIFWEICVHLMNFPWAASFNEVSVLTSRNFGLILSEEARANLWATWNWKRKCVIVIGAFTHTYETGCSQICHALIMPSFYQ